MSILGMRIAIAAVGLVIWFYGSSNDHEMARWIGIAMLAVATLLRFIRPRREPSE